MDECFICGVSGDRKKLFDVISKEGIVKICENCLDEQDMPIVKRPTTFQLKASEKEGKSFHERADDFSKQIKERERRRELAEKQNTTLKDIIEKNIRMKFSQQKQEKPRLNLIDNFHWVIMRARRKKHLTQKQLAENIKEAETTIKMVERGILPEDDYRIINKLENFLGIKITPPDFQPASFFEKKKELPKILDFEKGDLGNLTIEDLRKMKEEKELGKEKFN